MLAYVGGREWRESQFDRVADAHRQAGSAFKPIVYATAFALGIAAPASILDDSPLAVAAGGAVWQPRDDDGEFRGPLPARVALETSRNLPAARLGIETGLDAVIATARAMGVASPLEPVPSLSLGAFSLTPRELATVYATLAAQGVRPPVHLLAAALAADGEPLSLTPLPQAERALPAAVAYLLTDVLRGVLDRGTGQAARSLGVTDPLAGKTGTSNGGRDAWFAGYSPDRVTVVWVGRDDDAPTGLSGARAALPVWARFTLAVRPPAGYPPFVEPAGLVRALVDPASGELATTRCPDVERGALLGRACAARHLPSPRRMAGVARRAGGRRPDRAARVLPAPARRAVRRPTPEELRRPFGTRGQASPPPSLRPRPPAGRAGPTRRTVWGRRSGTRARTGRRDWSSRGRPRCPWARTRRGRRRGSGAGSRRRG